MLLYVDHPASPGLKPQMLTETLEDNIVVIIVDKATNITAMGTNVSGEYLTKRFCGGQNKRHFRLIFLIWYRYVTSIAAAIVLNIATFGT